MPGGTGRSAVRRRRLQSVLPAALLVVAGLVAGCGDGTANPGSSPAVTQTPNPTQAPSPAQTPTTSPAPGGSAEPAYCAAADKLRASVGALSSLSVTGGLPDVQAAIDRIQASLNEFAAAAQNQFGPQVSQMRSALTSVQTALRAAGASPNTTTFTAVATSVGQLVTAYNSLQQAVSSRCR